jgi:CheY-like chemotaxis protein
VKILWVENHERFVDIALRLFLADLDVTVRPSVASSLDALATASYDVVIVDYDLDDGKGTEVVAEIVRRPGRPWIVAASSHAAGNQALVDAGADAVCSKLAFKDIGTTVAGLTARPR